MATLYCSSSLLVPKDQDSQHWTHCLPGTMGAAPFIQLTKPPAWGGVASALCLSPALAPPSAHSCLSACLASRHHDSTRASSLTVSLPPTPTALSQLRFILYSV